MKESTYIGPRPDAKVTSPRGLVDPFTDNILGEWKFDLKSNAHSAIWYTRTAKIELAEAYAQPFHNPDTGVPQQIWGEVVLIEKKAIDKATSNISIHRSIEKTPLSKVKDVIA